MEISYTREQIAHAWYVVALFGLGCLLIGVGVLTLVRLQRREFAWVELRRG